MAGVESVPAQMRVVHGQLALGLGHVGDLKGMYAVLMARRLAASIGLCCIVGEADYRHPLNRLAIQMEAPIRLSARNPGSTTPNHHSKSVGWLCCL